MHDLLQPFKSITPRMLELAVRTCFDNGTMYCLRAQVVSGRLYITDYRAIFFDRYFAPSRVMPLLETLRRHRNLPDIDIVIAANDEPRVKTLVDGRFPKYWTRLCSSYPGARVGSVDGIRFADLPPPLFSSTVSRHHLDLPWLDFSFFMPRKEHKLRTPPWSVLHPKLVAEGGSVPWESKLELAMHTGNVGSPFRKVLAQVAKANPETMLVNELFIGDHGKIRKTCEELNLHAKGGFQQHVCYMTFQQQCRYKYLLQSASIGYANKFKYLLLCGSVVIYIEDGMTHKEFYEYGLLPGVHYVSAPTAADVPRMVEQLRKNDSYARSVAQAGRERLKALDVAVVTDFMAELLTEYAARQTFKVVPAQGATPIDRRTTCGGTTRATGLSCGISDRRQCHLRAPAERGRDTRPARLGRRLPGVQGAMCRLARSAQLRTAGCLQNVQGLAWRNEHERMERVPDDASTRHEVMTPSIGIVYASLMHV